MSRTQSRALPGRPWCAGRSPLQSCTSPPLWPRQCSARPPPPHRASPSPGPRRCAAGRRGDRTDRTRGRWITEPYPVPVVVSGAPRLHTTVTSSAPGTSLFAYLYDVDRFGNGNLITHEPVTLRDAEPGRPQPLDLVLEPALWEMPAGHRIALVIDTVDPRYGSESTPGSAITFSSAPGSPSRL